MQVRPHKVLRALARLFVRLIDVQLPMSATNGLRNR